MTAQQPCESTQNEEIVSNKLNVANSVTDIIHLNGAEAGIKLRVTNGGNPHPCYHGKGNLPVEGSVPRGTKTIISSARVISAEDRVDPAGSYYTAYLMQVEGLGQHRTIVEHRYSEFARLHAELSANDIHLRSSFPTKSICGRLGNWTPAAHWAPEKMAELVTYRKIKLDLWIIELTELLARDEQYTGIAGEIREMCIEFFQKSAAGCPPCDRANPVNWGGLSKELKSETCACLSDEVCFNPSLFMLVICVYLALLKTFAVAIPYLSPFTCTFFFSERTRILLQIKDLPHAMPVDQKS